MDWIGNLFIVVGLWHISSGKRWGFLSATIGEIIWLFYAWYTGQYSLVLICLIFAIMQFRGWLIFNKLGWAVPIRYIIHDDSDLPKHGQIDYYGQRVNIPEDGTVILHVADDLRLQINQVAIVSL